MRAVSVRSHPGRKLRGKTVHRGFDLFTGGEVLDLHHAAFQLVIPQDHRRRRADLVGPFHAPLHITAEGHIDLNAEQKFKDGDGPLFALHAETTDKLLLAASNGRVFTLDLHKLPGGRGMGEPVRLMIDLANDVDMVALLKHEPGRKLLFASSAGDGFVAAENELLAQTRTGKQVLNLKDDARAVVCRPVEGDHVACVGDNRKVLIFPLGELPEMTRGKGVRLQKFAGRKGGLPGLGGALSDATTFFLAEGLSWKDPAGRTSTETDLADWIGKRAQAGRMAPRGFPRENRFT